MPESGITIDISELTLGDLELLEGGSNVPFKDQMKILERIVTSEGGARSIKIKDIPAVMELVQAELEKLSNPTSGQA